MWQKVQGWGHKNLSWAGKETLVKAVIQAIPTHVMSCMRIPKVTGEEINRIIRKFWWGNADNNSIHWICWNEMCSAKGDGGLGFKDLDLFNLALLAKQGWRLLQNPSSLAARVLKGKYYPTGSFLNAQLGSNSSYMWRSFIQGREILLIGLKWRVGDGLSIGIWEDTWLPNINGGRILSNPHTLHPRAKVWELMDFTYGGWNVNLLNFLFHPIEVADILKIPLSLRWPKDEVIWAPNLTGRFSVRSAYHMARRLRSGNLNQSFILEEEILEEELVGES
ncbi:uncharacterized mitochondrial protein AtMg00310-like [Tripterygium wilfordii]|uniref:uncharacterized mitochondrial protein AtMg00310-like n=1 Tax=Tripterygium wilfordii TaxID=458696 RepID=UPI0018F825B2|nr:uncharacterized mitochondrial protein AtMg00310-like [Tripterygium wilfordii]